MSLHSICHHLFFLLLSLSLTSAPPTTHIQASRCQCNGCPAASISEWQAYSHIWAGWTKMPNPLPINFNSHCFSLQFARVFAFSSFVIKESLFCYLFCNEWFGASVFVRVLVELLLASIEKWYARHDPCFPVISGKSIWLAVSETDA